MQPIFSIGDAVSYGWGMTKKHIGFLILYILGFFVVNVILSMAAEGKFLPVLFEILNVIVNYLGMFIFFRIGLSIYRGEELRLGEVFAIDWGQFGLYLVGAILMLLATVAGFVLFIIPGIYISVRIGFAGFALIDEKLGPVDSIKRSWALTRGHFWNLFGFSVVLALLNILGVLLLGVGLLITSPICLIASVYVYQKLKGALAVVPANSVSPATVQ
jgi:uncharacterized membrane protein